jgi:hypothetical protein
MVDNITVIGYPRLADQSLRSLAHKHEVGIAWYVFVSFLFYHITHH